MPTFTDKLTIEQQSLRKENSNWMTTLAALAATGATRDSDLQKNAGVEGILLEVILSGKSGTPTITPKIYTEDDAGNKIVLVSFTALTADGTALYFIHPHADKTATVKNSLTEEGTLSLPRDWYLELTYGGTGTFTTEAHHCYVK